MPISILNVEDDPIVAQLIKAFVCAMDGFVFAQYGTAEGAEEALLDGADPDLFLLDIDLPGKSGLDLLSIIRKMPQFQDTPILMVTLRDDETAVLEAFRRGCTDYLQKPLNPEEFQSRLRSFQRVTLVEQGDVSGSLKVDARTCMYRRKTNPCRPFDVFCNFVATLSKTENKRFEFLAFGVTGMRRWQVHKGPQVSDDIMQALATVLSTWFKTDLQLVSRLGENFLVAACAGREHHDESNLQDLFEAELAKIFGAKIDAAIWPSVFVGSRQGSSAFAGDGADSLIRAVDKLARNALEGGKVLFVDDIHKKLQVELANRTHRRRDVAEISMNLRPLRSDLSGRTVVADFEADG